MKFSRPAIVFDSKGKSSIDLIKFEQQQGIVFTNTHAESLIINTNQSIHNGTVSLASSPIFHEFMTSLLIYAVMYCIKYTWRYTKLKLAKVIAKI